MQIRPIKTRPLTPPKDSLYGAMRAAKFSPKEGDIVCISSKVISIDEGRTLAITAVPDKETLIRQEADFYLEVPHTARRHRFTLTKGHMASSAGIDESNGHGHYVLYPRKPFESAKRLRNWILKEYRLKNIGVIITDSVSAPFRRGAMGFALSWDGIDPLRDYRGTKDIFGRTIKVEVANLVDALAAAAVFTMGEGAESTPIAIIRNAKNIVLKNRSPRSETQLLVNPEEDLFAPLMWEGHPWNPGGSGKKKR